MAAPYKSSDFEIVLKSGTHAMIRTNYDYYMPQTMDTWS